MTAIIREILLRIRNRASKTQGNLLSVVVNIGIWGTKRLWTRAKIAFTLLMLSIIVRLRREVIYRHEGISLSFKLTSITEMRMSRTMGQPFVRRQVFERLHKGSVFYDIGANIGIFALPAAKIVGEGGLVVAFEPESANYRRLTENLDRNNLHNVTALSLALGSENKFSWLSRASDEVGDGRPSLVGSANNAVEPRRILEAKLDDVITLWGLPTPQFIKIDVEDTELQVLNGMTKTLANPELQVLICEVTGHDPRNKPSQINADVVTKLLESYEFEVADRHLSGGHWPPIHEDILFLRLTD